MLSIADTNAIGQICDETFGKSSTTKSPSSSVVAKIENSDTLKVVYTVIVNFASERSLRDQVEQLDEENAKIVKDYISKLKKDFKKIMDKSLALKHTSSEPQIEMIAYNQFSELRTAYYRNTSLFELG